MNIHRLYQKIHQVSLLSILPLILYLNHICLFHIIQIHPLVKSIFITYLSKYLIYNSCQVFHHITIYQIYHPIVYFESIILNIL